MIDTAKIAVVTFDCDGVMFDSSSANRLYYNRLLEHVGLPEMTPDQFEYVHMHTVMESLDFLIPNDGLRQAALRHRPHMQVHDLIDHMVIEPHLVTLLDRLKPAYKTAIATNRMDTMDRLLRQFKLEHRFDLVVTAMDVEHPKPHPEQLQVILNHYGLTADQMLYIGDSQVDAQAAAAAQVPFIAFGNAELAAVDHLESLWQLVDLLNLS
jgi:HAD superfamily hydrolase (TIGR01509 family)